MRYIDSMGYMQISDNPQALPSSLVDQSHTSDRAHPAVNSTTMTGSGPSQQSGITNAGTRTGDATRHELRTQAAIRAVQNAQAQALYRGIPDSVSSQRTAAIGVGSTGAVTFTPTPASLAAEMHTGLLAGGRSHQYQQYQQPQLHGQHHRQQDRLYTSSGAHSNQGQGHASGDTFSSYPSGSDYTDYAHRQTGTGAHSGTASGSVSLSGALGHGGPSVQTLERRWGDVLQRVQA